MLNKNEKLTDKVFMRLVLFSFVIMLVCLTCLCSVTWAWFADTTLSQSNSISTSRAFELSVQATDSEDPNTVIVSIFGNQDDLTVTLEANKKYLVTLSLPAESSSGYLVITGGEKKYYSPTLIRHSEEEPTTVKFTVVSSEGGSFTFGTSWGIYSGDPSVSDGGELELS